MLHQSGFLPEPIAKVQKICETRKYLRNNLLFSEYCRDSTKKNALFFVFAAPKFAKVISKSPPICKKICKKKQKKRLKRLDTDGNCVILWALKDNRYED